MNIPDSKLADVGPCNGGLTEEQLEQQRMLAMRAWEMRPARRAPHVAYRFRRTTDSKAVAQHMLGALFVLGALMLIAKT